MRHLQKEYLINAPVARVWDALVNPVCIEGWGGGPAIMSEQEGMGFRLWGGDIYGTNTKVVPGVSLHQDWFAGEWDKPSLVTFTLSTHCDGTKLTLVHTDIPDTEFKDIDQGWDESYLGPLKDYLEKERG